MKFSPYAIFAIAAICAACAVATDPPGGPNMPIGPITPGSQTTITPNASSVPYASIQGPSPTMNVVAQDLLDLSLVVLNTQNSLIAFANLATTVIGTPGVVTSGRVFVDQVGWYGYTSATPFTANGVTVVTATAMGGGQWVHESVAFDNISSLALVSNLDARTITSRAFVKGFGWYYYRTPSGGEPTSQWRRPATAIGSGEWVHESINLIETVQVPVIGPAPLDAVIFPVGTAPGRLNRSIIDHGYLTHAMIAATDLTTTSASLVDVQNINLGPLLANDIIKAHLPAVAGCTANFRAATYVSVDGGGSYVQFSPGSAFAYPGSAGPTTIAVSLDFYRAMSGNSTGDVHVSIRIQSNGSATCTLSLGDSMIEVIRP